MQTCDRMFLYGHGGKTSPNICILGTLFGQKHGCCGRSLKLLVCSDWIIKTRQNVDLVVAETGHEKTLLASAGDTVLHELLIDLI